MSWKKKADRGLLLKVKILLFKLSYMEQLVFE